MSKLYWRYNYKIKKKYYDTLNSYNYDLSWNDKSLKR